MKLYEGQQPLLRAMVDANPAMMLVVDEKVRVLAANHAAQAVITPVESAVVRRRPGEILHCVSHDSHPRGCGHTEHCRTCVIREAVHKVSDGEILSRSRAMLKFERDGVVIAFYALVTAVPFEHEGRKLVLLTIEDINELANLWSILPVCAVCKKVRDDQQDWSEMEQYLKTHHDMRFTHGYCPECQEKIIKKQL